MNKPLSDIAAERGVLAGICQYGDSVYIDISDILGEDCFTSSYNKIVFACIENIYKTGEYRNIDIASIYSSAETLGLYDTITDSNFVNHIESLFIFNINKDNVRRLAVKLKKLQIARKYRHILSDTQENLLSITGDEAISEIMSICEQPIFDFAVTLDDKDSSPTKITEGLEDYIRDIAENPIDQIGIPTGFKRYDASIGGGLRPGTVNILAARTKAGKSILGANIGYNIAKSGIPILNLDTEMTREDHTNRLLAMVTECPINDIETGKFAKKPHFKNTVINLSRKLESGNLPYYHRTISGVSFEEQLSIVRRWLVKDVGLNSDGTAKPCVLVYDYLKLMSSDKISNALSEFQLLGFMMTQLHNMSVKYRFPVLCFLQLNRAGIDIERTDAASGSDRIVWLCSNFTILKEKSDEEIALDNPKNGNRKLVPIVCRHGHGIERGNYINCYLNGAIAKITEGKTRFEIENDRREDTESNYS